MRAVAQHAATNHEMPRNDTTRHDSTCRKFQKCHTCHSIPCRGIPRHPKTYTNAIHAMVFEGKAWHAMPYHVATHHGMPRHAMTYVTLRRDMPWHCMILCSIPWHDIPRHAQSWHGIRCHGIPWHTTSLHAMSWHRMANMPRVAAICHDMPLSCMSCHGKT